MKHRDPKPHPGPMHTYNRILSELFLVEGLK